MNKIFFSLVVIAFVLAACSTIKSTSKKLRKDDLYAYVYTERYVDPTNPSKSYTQIFDGKENRLSLKRISDWNYKGRSAVENVSRQIILADFQLDSLQNFLEANKMMENYHGRAFYEVKEDSIYPTRYYTFEIGRNNQWTRITIEGMDKEVKRDKYYKRMEKLETLLEDFVGVDDEDKKKKK